MRKEVVTIRESILKEKLIEVENNKYLIENYELYISIALEMMDNIGSIDSYIPIAIAGWCRYLMAIDDEANSFELSPGPLLLSLISIIDNIKLGEIENIHETLSQILFNKSIFGVNLYEIGLGTKIEDYFEELITRKGAVRSTLKKL